MSVDPRATDPRAGGSQPPVAPQGERYQATAPPQQQQYTAPPAQPTSGYVDPDARVVHETRAGNPALRIFQVLTGLAGAALFVLGLVAVFRVDFDAGFFSASAAVADFAVSPAMAIAAILLGGATLVAAFAAQDRGSAAFIGLLTLLIGIGALIFEGETSESIGVDRRSALLFVVLGAVVFVLSLIPWWSGRRHTTEVR